MADDGRKSPETEDGRYASTRLFQPGNSLSRQEEDIALAAELMNSGIASDREIAATVSDWSLHGSVSLAQHIEDKGLLTSEQMGKLQQDAFARVERARQSIAEGSEASGPGDSLLLETLERLDGSGRVAKLFGVTVAARSGGRDVRVMQGRYELIRKIGQGGLGRVWLARDVNLNRHVALKEISHPSAATESTIARFKNEAEVTGRLDHPSIVPIYQLGEDLSTERVFYTMRFLGKKTLQDSISEYHERREEGDDDPMLLRHLLTAFVNVCHAIGHAHSRKVIHRDLKPENVVIDSFGQVIVIDWGLAKIIDDTSVESFMDSAVISNTNCTSEGQVLGTPLYMAPEQAAGRLDELDNRTDIYGLGAILFSIITGNAPHEKTQREAVASGAGARAMISIIASGATPLAYEYNDQADPALGAICKKAMAPRRYARYQAATELAEEVQRWMADEPVSAYREHRWQRINRWISQHRRLSQTLLAAAMVTLVALTTFAVSARHSRDAALHARYVQMIGDIREVKLQLRGVVSELSKDARFLAALPPIQGIINSRNDVDEDPEEIWRERLETIFTGILRSNPEYLALSYESTNEDGVADIVRVERNPSDPTFVRVLPKSRLKEVESDELMTAVGSLESGDVKMTLETRTRHRNTSSTFDRLSVATPIYSEFSGECFGMTVIEVDISKQIMEIMLGQGAIDSEIFIADGSGDLWLSADPTRGVRVATQEELIPGLPEAVADKLSNEGEPFELRRTNEYLAERFYFDPNGRGVTILARLPTDD